MRGREAKTPPISPRNRRTRSCAVEGLEPRHLLSANLIYATPAVSNGGATQGVSGYTPTQVLHAYGFDTAATSIGAVGGDGAGQTIAIVDAYHDPTLAADVHAFDQQFGLADPPSLKVFDQNGGSAIAASDSLWSTETALDVEWAHAVAPGANIVIVEAQTADLGDLLTAVDTARHLTDVSVVSMSWGVSEFPTETKFDGVFTTPAGHQSITFIASSGDSASADGVQWPATSPNVVSVGGTALTVSATTDGQASETVFSGAISGVSQYESKPGYQNGASSAGARTIPDVVYDASPTPGFAVYNSKTGGWQTLGGTSSGAPQWAGLVAIANQVRASSGKASLNGSTQTLPGLYTYYGTNHHATINTSTDAAALNSGALLSDTGAPQATKVITALANNSGSGKNARGAKNDDASIAALIAAVPRKKVHPFILNAPAPLPLIHFAAPFAAAPKTLQAAVSVANQLVPNLSPVRQVNLPDTALSAGLMSELLGMALPEILSPSTDKADPIATLMSAIYGEIPALGVATVVPVGANSVLLASERRVNWFIVHINVAATFGDSIAAFVDECAILPPASTSLATASSPHGHLRAWVITMTVLAIDGIVLYYLISRRSPAVDLEDSAQLC